MPHRPGTEQRASDQLLWLGGAVIALVALTWLFLARPWTTGAAPVPTVTSITPHAPTAGKTPPGPAAGRDEPALDGTLRMAGLAVAAGMLLEPASFGAWDLYGRVLDQRPEHTEAQEGLAQVADALVERGRAALQQGRTGDARELSVLIRERLPSHPGARALTELLEARARAAVQPPRAAPAERPGRASNAGARPDPILALRGQFDQALAEERLLAPEEAAARTHLARLSALAPEHTATLEARERLFARFMALAGQATAALDTQAAGVWIDEAAALGVHVDAVADAREALTRRLVAAEENRLVAASDLTLLEYAAPEYPARAVTRGTEGWVDIEFTIGLNGHTQDITVTGASHESLFHESALASVAEWRFEPRSFMGTRISQRSFTRIRFALE